MIDTLIHALAAAILATIRHSGYLGIAALMAAESACIPIPSEIIMTFSGYLVSVKAMTLAGIIAAGTAGSLAGSLAAYALGAYGGLPFLVRYGNRILISHRDLERAHGWFLRHGPIAVFLGRLLPVLRTFISLPAGVARMPLPAFAAYSTAGSILWCGALGWLGLRLGRAWQALGPYMHRIDQAIVVVGAVLAVVAIRRHVAERARDRRLTGQAPAKDPRGPR